MRILIYRSLTDNMSFSWSQDTTTEFNFFRSSNIDSRTVFIYWLMFDSHWRLKWDCLLSRLFSTQILIHISSLLRSGSVVFILNFLILSSISYNWNFRLRVKWHFCIISAFNECSVCWIAINWHHQLRISQISILINIKRVFHTLNKILSPIQIYLFVLFIVVFVHVFCVQYILLWFKFILVCVCSNIFICFYFIHVFNSNWISFPEFLFKKNLQT